MVDFERGAKVAGSKFYFSTGEDALKEWTLTDFMIRYHVAAGYEFVIPPYLVNERVATVSGMLPDFAEDAYKTTCGLYLVPTAEKPMVGLHMDEMFQEKDLPLRYVAFSPCFRREAGSYGRRDKGLRRVHQFHKVELFEFHRPQDSHDALSAMIQHVEGMLDVIGVEHRTIELPEGERSPVAEVTFDIEIRHGDDWLEVSSLSNTGERQSKPASIRYKPMAGGKNIKCHLLNGSGVALPRLLLALEDLPLADLDKRLRTGGATS